MTAENASIPLLDLKAAESIGVALTPGQLAWRRFRKHRMALIGAIGISLLLLFIIIGSIVVPETGANNIDLYHRLSGPNAGSLVWHG
jgi:peptide/nickel transport system permease protein